MEHVVAGFGPNGERSALDAKRGEPLKTSGIRRRVADRDAQRVRIAARVLECLTQCRDVGGEIYRGSEDRDPAVGSLDEVCQHLRCDHPTEEHREAVRADRFGV